MGRRDKTQVEVTGGDGYTTGECVCVDGGGQDGSACDCKCVCVCVCVYKCVYA